MRKHLILLFTSVSALLLAACAIHSSPPTVEREIAPVTSPEDASAPVGTPMDELTTARLLIVDGAETGRLVLAGERGAYDVYTLDASSVPVTLDGESADASALEDGMTVEASFRDAETAQTPAALTQVESLAAYSRGSAEDPGGTAYDLCGLYLRVLEDLWDKDPGLNDGAKYLSVDLSTAPGELSEAAKFAIAWIFAQRHGAEALTLGYDELLEQGYLTGAEGAPESWREWRDGVLFRITPSARHEDEVYSLPAVFFNAEKWRSPLGAYFLADCTAVCAETGAWDGYQIGSEAIA